MSQTNCDENCSACGQDCESRKSNSLLATPNPLSSVKHIIAVTSGKGGVGKSTVTAMLAIELQRQGYHVGILDADITGPSIPRALHITERPKAVENSLIPVQSKTGIDVMSVNLLLEHETDPVLWRGPILGGTVKQFWTEVIWQDLDYLFIDMPPGTGDVPLTVFQSIPVDGTIIVSSPQDLVSMIVMKAWEMARMMNKTVLGLIENYSYILCPHCGKEIHVFGESNALEKTAAELQVPLLARLPIDPKIADAMDNGTLEDMQFQAILPAIDMIKRLS